MLLSPTCRGNPPTATLYVASIDLLLAGLSIFSPLQFFWCTCPSGVVQSLQDCKLIGWRSLIRLPLIYGVWCDPPPEGGCEEIASDPLLPLPQQWRRRTLWNLRVNLSAMMWNRGTERSLSIFWLYFSHVPLCTVGWNFFRCWLIFTVLSL